MTRPCLSGLAPLMNEFVLSRKAADAWNTTYSDNLHRFDNYCLENFPKQSELIEEMLAWCALRDTEEGNSCRIRTACVWHFVDYLRESGRTTIRSKRPKFVRDLSFAPHLFTDEELDLFFVECDRVCLAKRKRNQTFRTRLSTLEIPVFFRLLRSSGLRTCEARWLAISDIDFTTGVVSVRKSKGGGQHRIVLHQSMLGLLNRYIGFLFKLMPESDLLFPDAKGHPHDPKWESHNFRRIWSGVSREPARSYDFRHLYATQNIEAMGGAGCETDGQLMYLSRSMGHSSPAVTCTYFHYIPALHDKVERCSGDSFRDLLQNQSYHGKD
ncbi:MAG: tyrosine-type recombinase/integrase [Candidatus Cloacimonadaceae bacterium]|jgi:integrase